MGLEISKSGKTFEGKFYMLYVSQLRAIKLIITRKATGFKSLRVNCREINQVKSICEMDILNKTCKKRSKTEKENITIKFYVFQIV